MHLFVLFVHKPLLATEHTDQLEEPREMQPQPTE